jgi:hypothetical protein
MTGYTSNTGFNVARILLYKKPSDFSITGICGDINHTSFKSKPYTRSMKVLKGLLALNAPITKES